MKNIAHMLNDTNINEMLQLNHWTVTIFVRDFLSTPVTADDSTQSAQLIYSDYEVYSKGTSFLRHPPGEQALS